MIARLLASATERAAPFERVDLRDLLENLLVVARVKAASREIAIRFAGPPVVVRGRPEELRQVYANVIDNAIDAARSRVAIRLRPAVRGIADVFVEDDGPGVAPGTPIYDPMVTTKEKGVGVGLFAVRRIVLEHGGEIGHDRSRRLGGARFRVALPQGTA
jgi:C4-dicarboxylate-specific signal transduction histidine kinase